MPVSTIAADSSNPSSSGPELQPAFVKCVKAIREQSFMEMREAEMKAAVTKWSLFLCLSLEHSLVGRQINSSPGEMLDNCQGSNGSEITVHCSLPSKLDVSIHEVAYSWTPE